jgi:hypothetical protein
VRFPIRIVGRCMTSSTVLVREARGKVYQGNGQFNFTGAFSQFGPAGVSTGGTGENANLDFLTGAMNTFRHFR